MPNIRGCRIVASGRIGHWRFDDAGDRIVYHRDGIYHVDTVASATGSFYSGSPRPHDVTIITEAGDVWSCSHEN